MPFLVLKDVTVKNTDGDAFTHPAGSVVSDFELPEHVRDRVQDGHTHYRALLEPLTDDEARHERAKATSIEGDHIVDGEAVSAPWEDYVGLHPAEIIARLKVSESLDEVTNVKRYEAGGMNRQVIMDYTAPVERPPFRNYDELTVREIMDKLSVLGDQDVQNVIRYESAHRRRPAIITYEKELFEREAGGEKQDKKSAEPVKA